MYFRRGQTCVSSTLHHKLSWMITLLLLCASSMAQGRIADEVTASHRTTDGETITISTETDHGENGVRRDLVSIVRHRDHRPVWTHTLVLQGSARIEQLVETGTGDILIAGTLDGRLQNREISISSGRQEGVFLIGLDQDGQVTGQHLIFGTRVSSGVTLHHDGSNTHLRFHDNDGERGHLFDFEIGSDAAVSSAVVTPYRLGSRSDNSGLPALELGQHVTRLVISGQMTDVRQLLAEDDTVLELDLYEHAGEAGGTDPDPPNPNPPPPPPPPSGGGSGGD